ncbi:MAG: iron-sulfur cluster assembly accessory protein [Gammaproteobacteria bacterium]
MNQSNKPLIFSPNGVSLTKAAEDHFLRSLKSSTHTTAIRIGIRKAGCSGYEYYFELSNDFRDDDYVLIFSDKKLVIDKNSIEFIKGSEIDYIDDGINQGIRFNNPNAKAVCGCGESFTI